MEGNHKLEPGGGKRARKRQTQLADSNWPKEKGTQASNIPEATSGGKLPLAPLCMFVCGHCALRCLYTHNTQEVKNKNKNEETLEFTVCFVDF